MTEQKHDFDIYNADVDSPGEPSKPLDIHPQAKEGGARISKNAKKIVFIAIAGLGVALVLGILATSKSDTPGSSSSDSKAVSESESQAVGRNKAPSPPETPPASMLQQGGTGPAAGATGAASGVQGAQPLSQAQAMQRGQGLSQDNMSPAAKYKAWLVDHKYKNLEGNILSSESAQESGFGDASMSHQQPSSNPALPQPGSQGLIDAIRAAAVANGGSVDQATIARIMAQQQGPTGAGSAAADAQQQNKNFVAENKKTDDGYLNASVENALGQHELLAGSIIPAVLLTAMDSDLPGFVTAMVRQTIYDSIDHKSVLVPQGAKLVGRYSSDVAYGQVRALVAWNRLIFPNGAMIDLQGMSGTDGQGQSGFEDQVDHHYMKVFGSSILISLLGAGAQLSQPQSGLQNIQPTPQQQAAAAMATGMANTGNQLLSKNLSIQPTIKIRAGYLFNVMVNKSMIMPIWQGEQK